MPTERSAWRWLVVCGAIMVAALALPHLGRSAVEQTRLIVLTCGLCGSAYAALMWRLHGRSAPPSCGPRDLLLVLGFALLMRLMLLPLLPASSGDVYRYLWEGLVQKQGVDPYRTPPADAALDPLAAAYPFQGTGVRREPQHAVITAIYPPVVQALFLLNAWLSDGTLLGWKLILLSFDALLLAACAVLLQRRGAPLVWLAGVAWCPLLLIESYEAAHLDLIGVALLVCALVLLERRQLLAAGVLLGLAVNVKYPWPLLALAYLALRERSLPRAGLLAGGAAAAFGASWLPYLGGAEQAFATLRFFSRGWRFNGLVYGQLEQALPPWAPGLVVLVLLAAGLALLSRRPAGAPWHDVWLIIGLGLLLSPVSFPWYFLWAAPALLLCPPLWMLAWVLLLPLLHLAQISYLGGGPFAVPAALHWLLALVPGGLLIVAWIARARVLSADPPVVSSKQLDPSPHA